jgi:uncharacterized DUF497 family protein
MTQRRTWRTGPSTVCRSPLAWSFLRTASVRCRTGRLDYGEARVNAFGLVEERLFVCTYTMRNETYRLISVRKASRQEQRTWLLL